MIRRLGRAEDVTTRQFRKKRELSNQLFYRKQKIEKLDWTAGTCLVGHTGKFAECLDLAMIFRRIVQQASTKSILQMHLQ